MTTIGYATLQIIPSLRGVTEAIDKDIDGKVVGIQIAPKVDQRATEAAAKQTRETIEKQTGDVKVQPKVDVRAAEQAGKTVGDAVTKGTKDAVRNGDIGDTVGDAIKESAQKPSFAREAAKVIVEGIAGGMKEELNGGPLVDEMVDGVVNGLKWGIDNARVSVGKAIVGSISDSIKAGDLGGKIRDAVLPTVTNLGSALRQGASRWSSGIANALRSGDIQSATDEIGSRVRTTTDVIATIGSTFGLQLDGVREFGDGSATTLQTVGSNLQSILGTAATVKSTFADTGELLGTVLPGRAGTGAKSIVNSLGTIIPVAGAVFEALDRITQNWHTQQQERFWARWEEDRRAQDMGLKPQQPGVGDFNGPPRVGQGNAPMAPKTVPLPDQIRTKIQAGQLPGYSLTPDGHILGPDGKPLPGLSVGGYTGNVPMKQIAGVVHGDEFVVQAISRQRIENRWPGVLDYMNATGTLPGYAGGGLVAGTAQLRKIIGERFGISNIGGYRPADGYNEHSTGRALDVMVGSDKPKGDAVKDFAVDNASAIDLKWAIWQQKLWYPGGRSEKMATRANGDPTQNHMDHVHIFSGPGITNGLLGALKSKGGENAPSVAAGVNPPVGDTTIGSGSATAMSGGAETSAGDGGFNLPSSISGLSTTGLGDMGVKTQVPGQPERTFEFGNAAAAAVGGQVSSALGVFGVPDTPGWLQGISTFVSGLSISDKSGKKIVGGGSAGGALGGMGSLVGNSAAQDGYGSAAPIAASANVPTAAAVPAGNVHGGQAGRAPGPVFNTTISAFNTSDAVSIMEQRQNEITAAKLGRWS
ncbi:phage tail protein [Mycobacteroides abscessus]|uniref:phage tail protein n=1 Tax=Mycobacteroides abscessus TaxID=36809 RepID=UPI001F4778C8|nr:phage tail protein [Mycobacteroides abscessus]